MLPLFALGAACRVSTGLLPSVAGSDQRRHVRRGALQSSAGSWRSVPPVRLCANCSLVDLCQRWNKLCSCHPVRGRRSCPIAGLQEGGTSDVLYMLCVCETQYRLTCTFIAQFCNEPSLMSLFKGKSFHHGSSSSVPQLSCIGSCMWPSGFHGAIGAHRGAYFYSYAPFLCWQLLSSAVFLPHT